MDVRVQVPPSAPSFLKIEYARVVELADSLDSGSSAHYGRAGSSPASRTIEKPLKTGRFQGFRCVYRGGFPLFFPLTDLFCVFCCLNALNKVVHSAGALTPHLLCDMGVSIQRECRSVMA